MHGSLYDAAFVAHDHGADGARLCCRTWRSSQAAAHATAPVLLFRQGSGERGDDNRAQTRVGLGPALLRDPPPWPLLAVFPQLPAGARWSGSHADDAIAILDDARMRVGGDRARVALTGPLRGGYDVLELALRWPRRFRALVPVRGGITAPPHDAALQAAAAPVHYRELPEAQHNVRDAAYADPTLWRWLARTLDEET